MIYYTHELTKEKLSTIANLPESDTVTFDGVHKSVYELWNDILRDRLVILFPVGDWVGKFGFCDWNEIMDMVYRGATLGWHSREHREPFMNNWDDALPPLGLKIDHFALPYGRFKEPYLEGAKKRFKYIYGTNVPHKDILLREEL